MSAEISPQNERYLEQVVAQGVYRNRTEAMDEVVELLKRRDRLRSEVRAGIEQANRGELLDPESVFQRLLERAHQTESTAQRAT